MSISSFTAGPTARSRWNCGDRIRALGFAFREKCVIASQKAKQSRKVAGLDCFASRFAMTHFSRKAKPYALIVTPVGILPAMPAEPAERHRQNACATSVSSSADRPVGHRYDPRNQGCIPSSLIIRCRPLFLLGRSQAVRQRVLIPSSQVRFLAPQPVSRDQGTDRITPSDWPVVIGRASISCAAPSCLR